MNWARVIAARLRALWSRTRMEDELDDEIRFHLEMQMEDNLKAGMDPEEARYAALRSFGSVESMKESYRERRSIAMIEATVQDLKYAVRTLRMSPGFTATAVTVLALAIGANTAMFSVLNTVLLRPLPYRAPEQLAMLWSEDPSRNFREGRSALWDVEQWRNQNRSFEGLATFDAMSMFWTGTDGVEQITGVGVSPNLFALLGVQPVLGRSFGDGGPNQILISHRFWQTRFGGSRDLLGTSMTLNGASCQIIGILPPDFQIARLNADVWQAQEQRTAVRGKEAWFVVGRLRPGVTVEQAQADMSGLPEQRLAIRVVPMHLYVVGAQSRLGLWMLGGGVFCVFLIAAANVTSLSLARSAFRAREIAVRAALGASAGRIVRQLLTEGLVLAVIAGLIGTLLAWVLMDLIRVLGPANLARLNEVHLDLRVLGWALAITVVAGMLVGLPPAIAMLRGNSRPSGGSGVAGGVGVRRVRRALVVADFALAILLLAAAGLLIRSWWNVNSVHPGFRMERTLVLQVSAPAAFSIPAKQQFYQRAIERMQAMPDVEDAGVMGELFKENNRQELVTVERDGGASAERLQFSSEEISAGVFRAIGTPLLRGHFFSNADGPDAPAVAIINDAMARRSWPRQDAMGKRFKMGALDSVNRWYTVVGVVADMRAQGPEREAIAQVFVPLSQSGPPRNVDLFIRTRSMDPQAMVGAIRTALREVDRNASIGGAVTLKEQFGTYTAERRFQALLLIGFSLTALLMAAVGIHGLIQYSIATRTHEIGIRMAIGAQATQIFRMVLAEGLQLGAMGLVLGLSGALVLAKAGSKLLFGVSATDPLTFVVVSIVPIAVATAACWLPARRAMKIEPILALRQN